MGPYAEACRTEIRSAYDEGSIPSADTVFFGGGTPSRIEAASLASILRTIPRAVGAEVTVECNPEDASPELFDTWLSAGVTRVSFGVQSMVDHVLESLGRRHDPSTVRTAVALASTAGFESWSIDLIFGAAGETDADWEHTLSEATSLDPEPPHISAYSLTVEPGTPLASDPLRFPDDDVQAHRYEMADAFLTGSGYQWYEVSNWSRPGHNCRHNDLYWQQGDYLGIGCAAHSHISGRRWWNIRTPDRYIAAVQSGRTVLAGEEILSRQQREFEALALALRTRAGVPEAALPDSDDLIGLVERSHGRATLTVRGRLLANELTTRLVPTAAD
jgi:oxygen-independent coproporphyrinogen-3 oxidase